MKSVIVCVILFISLHAHAQFMQDSIEVNVSGRVDTTNTDINQIYTLFKTYLQSRPDSIRYNPYWSKVEQAKNTQGNIALFYTPFYNLGADPKTIFSIWKPFVLSIEPKSPNKYLLRVALIKKDDAPDKVLTILNINAIVEEGKWVLQNTRADIVDTWQQRPYQYLNYCFPPGYAFNQKLAEKSIAYCDSICNVLNIKQQDTFTYFICDNPDQMGLLFGYEFYYLNYTTGLTIKWRNEMYSAKNSEFYPHEFMHMLFATLNNDSIHYVIEEGLACFLGELGTQKYKAQIASLANDYLANKPTYTLDNLLNNDAEWNGYQTAYPTGSILAEIVYAKRGYDGLRKLLMSNTTTTSQLYRAIYQITRLDTKQLEKEFRSRLRNHLAKQK